MNKHNYCLRAENILRDCINILTEGKFVSIVYNASSEAQNVRSAPLSWDTRATPRSLSPAVIGGPCHCHSVSTCSLPPKTCGVHVNKSQRLARWAVPSKHLAFPLVARSHAHTAYSNLLLYTSWFQENKTQRQSEHQLFR